MALEHNTAFNAIGGLVIATVGAVGLFVLDFVTFLVGSPWFAAVRFDTATSEPADLKPVATATDGGQRDDRSTGAASDGGSTGAPPDEEPAQTPTDGEPTPTDEGGAIRDPTTNESGPHDEGPGDSYVFDLRVGVRCFRGSVL